MSPVDALALYVEATPTTPAPEPVTSATGAAARPYDMRATFISDALHAGVPVFTVAKVAGTSVRMIERAYGRLLDGAMADIAGRLDALDAERDLDGPARASD